MEVLPVVQEQQVVVLQVIQVVQVEILVVQEVVEIQEGREETPAVLVQPEEVQPREVGLQEVREQQVQEIKTTLNNKVRKLVQQLR